MLNLKGSNISYILLSSNDLSGLSSYLYSRDYHLLDIKEFYKGEFGSSLIAFTSSSNDDLRRDAIRIISNFGINSVIVKYNEDVNAIRINSNGSEDQLKLLLYNTDSNNISYIYEGLSFSFIEQPSYFFPKSKSDFKFGMIVECFSNNKWIEKRVTDPDIEYQKMYSLLMKYNKVRILR